MVCSQSVVRHNRELHPAHDRRYVRFSASWWASVCRSSGLCRFQTAAALHRLQQRLRLCVSEDVTDQIVERFASFHELLHVDHNQRELE